MKLREKVAQILRRHNHEMATLWLSNFWVGEVESFEEEVRHINAYLRHQLGLLPVNTIHERECLKDDVDEDIWLSTFESEVAPSIVIHGLPAWRGLTTQTP
jgi:hypothetical protein